MAIEGSLGGVKGRKEGPVKREDMVDRLEWTECKLAYWCHSSQSLVRVEYNRGDMAMRVMIMPLGCKGQEVSASFLAEGFAGVRVHSNPQF